jgi:RimJ/RimL family protein N-acetyltransferase
MKSAFRVIYLIEIEENGGRRVIGFLGLYGMELGRNLSLSLTVFNPGDRRRGYGEEALTLLLNLLQKNKAAEAVYAEILKTNVPSLRLCRKLGFKVKRLHQDTLLLEKNEKIKSRER